MAEIVNYDLYAHQGDSYCSDVMQRLVDGVPFANLTNAIGLCQLRSRPYNTVSATLSVIIDNAAECKYHLEAAAPVMAAVPATETPYTEYDYDVQFSWPSGFVCTMQKGIFNISPEVSR